MLINSINYPNKGLIDKASDGLMIPTAYLFNGKKISYLPETGKIQETQRYPNKSWIKTALAIIFLVPTFFLGLILKLGAFISSSDFRAARNECLKKAKNKDLQKGTPKIPGLPIEDLEKEFWSYYSVDSQFAKLFRLVIKNQGAKPIKKAKFVLDILQDATPSLYARIRTQRQILESRISKHIEIVSEHPSIESYEKKPKRNNIDGLTRPIIEGKVYAIPTKGEGSCAFHALLGNTNKSSSLVECKDVADQRKKFCLWLKNRFENKTLPTEIYTLLMNYYHHFNDRGVVPKNIKDKASAIYEQYQKGYDDLSNDEKDNRANSFIYNEVFYTAYLEDMEKITTYIDQDELIAMAQCFNKTIRLYQPDWNRNSPKIDVAEYVINEGASEPINIHFNGANHYERAVLLE